MSDGFVTLPAGRQTAGLPAGRLNVSPQADDSSSRRQAAGLPAGRQTVFPQVYYNKV